MGGLGQVRPAQQPVKQENLAARAASMVQAPEETAPADDYFAKTMRDLQTQRQALNEQTNKLLGSLDARKGRLFDPVLMQAAAGFAKPTKTGSFGESLGYAAEAAAGEAEKEFARNQQIEKLKLEMTQKQYEQAQQQAISGHMMSKLSPGFSLTGGAGPAKSMAAPAGAATDRAPMAAPGAAPMTAPGSAPMPPQTGAAAPHPVTRTGAPRMQPLITDKDIMEASILDPSGKLAQHYRDIAKMQQEDVTPIGDRPYSRSRQEFLPQDPNKVVEVDFGPLFSGPKKVPYSVYEQWKGIHDSGDRAAELDFFYGQNWLKRPAGSKPGVVTEPPTADERAAQRETNLKRQEAQIAQEKEQIGRLDTNFTQARTIINAANSMKGLATSNPRAFDLMNDEGIAAAVARAAQKGIQAGNFGSITLPASELASYKLNKGDREALQMFARDYAEMTVAFRKSSRVPGEGATTEREGDLYAALGAQPADTSRVIRLKSEFLVLKGRYDQEVFKAWSKFSKDPSNSYRDFLASDDFGKVVNAYDHRLGEIQKANAALFGAPPKAPTEPKPVDGAKNTPAQNAPPPPPKLGSPGYKGLPVGGLYEDKDGTIRRKK